MNPANKTNNDREYFAALDGFRGILALCVAIYHTYWTTNTNSLAFFNNGPVVIDLFFVFSGFLLYRLYGQKISSPKQAREFLKRRFARLYPLHFFMLMVFFGFAVMRYLSHKVGVSNLEAGEVLPFEAGSTETMFSFLTNLTLTHAMGLHDSLTYNPPSWTISVEFFAYFTFAILLIYQRLTKVWHFCGLASVIALIYFGLSHVKPNMDITHDLAFFRCLGGFYTGVIGAAIFSYMKDIRGFSLSGPLSHIVEIITLALSLGFVIYCPGKLQFFIAPVALIFILVFAYDGGVISRILSLRIFRYFAKISYSVYMTHVIISIFFYMGAVKLLPLIFGSGWLDRGINGDLYLIPYIIVVLMFSHFTWTFIENPGRKLLTRIDIFPWKIEKKDIIQSKSSM